MFFNRCMQGIVGAAFALTVTATAVSATTLSSANLFAPADGLLTRDSATGLEWLDLTATANRAKTDVLAAGADVDGFGNDWLDLGFVFATKLQISALWSNHGFTVIDGGFAAANSLALYESFVALLGETTAQNGTTRITQGYSVGSPGPGGTHAPRLIFDSQGDSGNPGTSLETGANFGDSIPTPDFGSWLVRVSVIAEPMTLGLFGFGLLALGAATRRKCTART